MNHTSTNQSETTNILNIGTKNRKLEQILHIKSFKTYPTRNHNSSNNWYKSSIRNPSFSLKGGQIGKESGEERRGCTDSLIEGNSQIPKRDVATDNGRTENHTQSCDFEKLRPRFDHLVRHDFEEDDRNVAEDGAGGHMAHCEEDWEFEAIIGEQVFVEKDYANVGSIPERHQRSNEYGFFLQGWRHFLVLVLLQRPGCCRWW